MYEERPALLGGAVVWRRRDVRPGPYRVLPDGGTDVILTPRGLLVAGPDTRAHVGTGEAGDTFTGLRFAPGQGPAVLGAPAHELRNLRVPLADLWGERRARLAAERVAAAADPGAALEALARARLADAEPPEPYVPAVVEALAAGRPVAEVAGAVGLGERQLHRRSLAVFGYGPKTLARVLRMNRALALARAGTPPAGVAALTGYADQAHLAREMRALAGVPLTALL